MQAQKSTDSRIAQPVVVSMVGKKSGWTSSSSFVLEVAFLYHVTGSCKGLVFH